MSLFSAPLFSTSFVIYMKGLVDKSLSSQNGQIPNFIFHARKEFVIITSPGQDGIRELVLGWTCTIERHLVLRRYVLMAEWLCISHASMIFFYVVLMNVWHSYHLLLNGEHSSKVHRAKKSDQWEESSSSDGARRKYGGLQCIHRQNIITSIIAESVFHNDIFFRFFLEEIMRYYSTLHGI